MTLRNISRIRAVLAIGLFAACGGDSDQQAPNAAAGGGGTAGVPGVTDVAGMGTPAVTSGTGSTPPAAGAAGTTSMSRAGAGPGGASAGAAGAGTTGGAGGAAGIGAAAGSGGSPTGAAGAAGGDMPATGSGGATSPSDGTTCDSLPAVTNYGSPGPFDAKMFTGVGPDRNYTMFRPSTSLGKDGFKHPIASWGNGISTTPDMYQKLLLHIASHGFVIIGCNDTQAERPCVNSGMDWLVMQNAESGELQGKLDVNREVIVGYSWGGGAAIDTSDRPNVKATISLHGMPPRVTDIWGKLHAPLLLTTSTGDAFVTASGYVTPNYEKAVGQTFYATLQDSNAGHLYIADKNAGICIGELLGATFGTCGDAAAEQAPAVAWLRYWACGDQGAKNYFYGDDCVMCKSPWIMPQRKMWQ